MADAILDTVSADIVCEDQVFRASGHTVAFPGFTAVYEEGTDDEKKQDSAGKPLPRFDQGDKLTAEKIEPSQHFTQPPARYTEASLIRAMEERGIGRPSTYAPTISTIIDRDYVTKENKALRPTPLGEGVTGLLVDEFKSVADYEFTANMEHELDEVEAGKLNYIQLLHNFYDGFEAALNRRRSIWRAAHQDSGRGDRRYLREMRTQHGHQVRPIRQIPCVPGFPGVHQHQAHHRGHRRCVPGFAAQRS